MENTTTPSILFYRYGSICEPDLIQAFTSLNISVVEEDFEIHTKAINHNTRIEILAKHLLSHTYSFVFSLNYFPHISEVCERLKVPYVCWSVDCPVAELFSPSVANSCNHIFLFDYMQYMRFSPYNPEHIYYLPLATNPSRWDEVFASISEGDLTQYTHEVSFVGSLYTEKSPLAGIQLPDVLTGYIDGLIDSQLLIYGLNFLEECVTPELIHALYNHSPLFRELAGAYPNSEAYIAANHFIGMEAAKRERIRTLNKLAANTPVTLYTHSDVSSIHHADCRPGVRTLTEMPKIFHLSKINLNITMRPIQSGLSLRIWDVLGCGGFLLTNFQSEISEYFEIGRDLVCYESLPDLLEKTNYYLHHEDERKTIAANGYEKVKLHHSYTNRLRDIIQTISST